MLSVAGCNFCLICWCLFLCILMSKQYFSDVCHTSKQIKYWFRNYITLRASCDAVYCNRSRLFCMWLGGCVTANDNLKFRASILTKLGLSVKVVTISSWLNFDRPAPPGRGLRRGECFWLGLTTAMQRTVFASPLSAFFIWVLVVHFEIYFVQKKCSVYFQRP